MRSFLDTNVLVYVDAGDDAVRQARAIELVRAHLLAGTGVISTQVLQEFVNVALRKLKLPAPLIRQRVALYRRFDVIPSSADLISAALDLHVLHGWSFYDALIFRAAIESGARVLLSEDLQHGFTHAGLRVSNPFMD